MKPKKKYIILLIPLVIELFICNAKFWTFNLMHHETEKNLILSGFQMEGLEQSEPGSNIFRIIDADQHYLEFVQLDQNVNSVYLDFLLKGTTETYEYIKCDIYTKDEGEASNYYHIPSDGSKCVLVSDVEESKWFQTRFYGKLKSLKIQFDEEQMKTGNCIVLSAVTINKSKALHFSLGRVICMELLVILALIFKKGSKYYGQAYMEQGKHQKVCLGTVLIFQIFCLFFMLNTVKPYIEQKMTTGGSHEQYQKLAVAMAEGHVYLNDKVPEWLMEMENPYDTYERAVFNSKTNEFYLWDNAYYQGHYYVYFGVIPVLIAYLPYYLICHADLPNYVPIFLSWVVICLASARLIGTMLKKWFPAFPYILYLLITAIFPFCIGAIAIMQRPTIYEVPISMGIMFAVLGLDLWLESVQAGAIVSVPKVAAGSLCVALVAGCRPNIFLVFLFCFIIFGEIFYKKKENICKYWKAMIAFCLPFLVVAAGLMYYNWIRFGSVFDFGANYNLTNNDLTKRGFNIGRIGLGLFEFFWKPFALSVRFPFIKAQRVESAYMGKTICISQIGGIMVLCPFFLMIITAIIYRKRLKEYKQPFYLMILSVLSAVFIAAVTVNMAGIYPRYKADFGLLIGIASVLAVGMLDKYLAADHQNTAVLESFQVLVFYECMMNILLNFLSFFVTVEYTLDTYNPQRYYFMKYFFEFWH